MYEAFSRAAENGFHNNVTIEEDTVLYNGRTLAKTHEKDKFVLGYLDCKKGTQHLRECTPDNIRDCIDKLSCVFCVKHLLEKGWQSEQDFIGKVKELHIDEKFMFQVQAPWQETGLVDFVYMPMKEGSLPTEGWVYVQVDGSSHFKVTRKVEVHIKLDTDMQQCEVALSAGSRLIRLHHADLDKVGDIIEAVDKYPSKPFVLLSPSFAAVKHKKPPPSYMIDKAQGGMGNLGVPYVLRDRLGKEAHMEICTGGCFCFTPSG